MKTLHFKSHALGLLLGAMIFAPPCAVAQTSAERATPIRVSNAVLRSNEVRGATVAQPVSWRGRYYGYGYGGYGYGRPYGSYYYGGPRYYSRYPSYYDPYYGGYGYRSNYYGPPRAAYYGSPYAGAARVGPLRFYWR